jgi:phosphatidyl-myo-inositol dimannoside synthase
MDSFRHRDNLGAFRASRNTRPMRSLRVLTIGHSYTVALNRAVMSRVVRDPNIELTVVAPRYFRGDLRPLALEASDTEPYRLEGLDARLTQYIHIFFYEGLHRLLSPGAFDLVHSWEEPYILAGYQIARAASAAGSRFFFRTAQSLPKAYPPPFSGFERYCASHASGWIAGGNLVHEALRKRRGYPALSEIITLGVDEEKFRPDPQAGAALRRSLGLEGPVIGFVGRLTAAKGLDVLMDALEQVPGPWNLLALGSGPYESRVNRWAESRGFGDRVKVLLVGHSDVPRYLQAMDLLVAPSQTTPKWKEQFGRMIVEAFASGVPVIGSDSGEIPFVIDDVGVVVAESDAAGWAAAINELLESPDRRRELSEQGIERFQSLYTSTRVAERYVDFYRRVVETSPQSVRRARGAVPS